MVLWGLVLGALLGAAYGAMAANLLFLISMLVEGPTDTSQLTDPMLGPLLTAFAGISFYSAIFGVPLGALVGFALGVLDGLVLFALTRTLFHPMPVNKEVYRQAAGWVCAAAGSAVWLVVELTDHGFPGRSPSVADGTGFPSISPSVSDTANLAAAFVFWIVGPTIVAFWAMRHAGRKVAGQYAQEFSAAGSANAAPATGSGRPEES